MSKQFLEKSFSLKGLDDTKRLAQTLARSLKNQDILALEGDLGSGKTTFCRFLIQELLGKSVDVTSPTFNLVQMYDAPDFPIWHFDLYRMEDPDEIFEVGFEEALSHGLVLIEWPSRAGPYLPKNCLKLSFSIENDHSRRATLQSSASKDISRN